MAEEAQVGISGAMKLSELPAFDGDSQLVHVIIEAPKGSRIKLKYKEEFGAFAAEKVLPPGLVFPFDFGFIPSTRAEDGDPRRAGPKRDGIASNERRDGKGAKNAQV